MACCVCFFQGSKPWIALLVPVVALSARLSSFHGILLPFSVLVLSSFCLSAFFKQKKVENSLVLQKPSKPDETDPQQLPSQEKTLISSSGEPGKSVAADHPAEESVKEKFVVRSAQDLYSESDQCSSTSSEDHSSDTEWHYNLRQGGLMDDCSDDSISDDEDSLFEIAIPKLISIPKCCQDQSGHKDFLADINEDNLIEIDINMGSIKYCSSFEI